MKRAGLVLAYCVMCAIPPCGVMMLFLDRSFEGAAFLAMTPSLAALHAGLLFSTGAIRGIGGVVMLPLMLGAVAVTLSPAVPWWYEAGEPVAMGITFFVCLVLMGLSLFLGLAVVNIRSELRTLFADPRVLLRLPKLRDVSGGEYLQ